VARSVGLVVSCRTPARVTIKGSDGYIAISFEGEARGGSPGVRDWKVLHANSLMPGGASTGSALGSSTGGRVHAAHRALREKASGGVNTRGVVEPMFLQQYNSGISVQEITVDNGLFRRRPSRAIGRGKGDGGLGLRRPFAWKAQCAVPQLTSPPERRGNCMSQNRG
jgi:hypothetical protein